MCVHVDEAVMGLSVHTDEDGGGDNPLLSWFCWAPRARTCSGPVRAPDVRTAVAWCPGVHGGGQTSGNGRRLEFMAQAMILHTKSEI